ncbi:MAG: hypothetical protein K2X47_00935 [Bdellovibrionales bacterium]|nr:hypothetical protein [Bdellovibrionales bacterium]
MKKINLFFASFILATLQAYALTPQETFKAAFDSYGSAMPTKLNPATAARIQQYEYVFVAGFLNEGIALYFEDNIQTLRRSGIPAENIHVLRSSSRISVGDSLGPIARQFFRLHRKSKRKLIVIAHSRGGAETLGAVFKYPKLLEEVVEKVILIQSALGGSPLADYVSGKEKKELSAQIPAVHQARFRATAAAGKISNLYISKGTQSLTRQKMAAFWARIFSNADPTTIQLADKKINYIVSFKDPSKMASLVDATGWYLQTSYGPNDGMILLRHQYLDGFGTLLATLNADHTDLTTSWPYSSAPSKIREAMTKAILQVL